MLIYESGDGSLTYFYDASPIQLHFLLTQFLRYLKDFLVIFMKCHVTSNEEGLGD